MTEEQLCSHCRAPGHTSENCYHKKWITKAQQKMAERKKKA